MWEWSQGLQWTQLYVNMGNSSQGQVKSYLGLQERVQRNTENTENMENTDWQELQS
jgi:hypothetical protein